MARIIVSSPVFFQGHGCSEKNSSIYVWREKHLDIFPRVLYFISKTAKSFSHTTEAENIIFTIECIFTHKHVKVVEYVWTVDPILLSATIYLFFFLCPCFVSVLSLFLYPLQCREYSGPILLSAGIKQGKQGISQTDRAPTQRTWKLEFPLRKAAKKGYFSDMRWL